MAEARFEIADIGLDHEKRILEVTWGDGHQSFYPLGYLRRNCPCANCREFRRQEEAGGGLRVLSDSASVATDELVDLKTVGHYAMQPVWSDGHNTGIFGFDYLRNLCPCEKCRGQ